MPEQFCATCDTALTVGAKQTRLVYCSQACRVEAKYRRRVEYLQKRLQMHTGRMAGVTVPTMRILEQRWRDKARCAGELGLNWFPDTMLEAEPALQMCARCPVTAECFQEAVSCYESGVWGGAFFRYGVPYQTRLCPKCLIIHATRCPK